MTNKKTCTKCGVTKNTDEFYRRKKTNGEYAFKTACKKCLNEQSKAYKLRPYKEKKVQPKEERKSYITINHQVNHTGLLHCFKL